MFKTEFKRCLCCVLIFLLAGCAHDFRLPHFGAVSEDSDSANAGNCASLDSPKEKVELQIIEQLMDSGKLHAALAHLDATRLNSPRETYIRAEILRRTGRAQLAKPLYNRLLPGCAAGYAYHGLGLIAGREGNIGTALEHLRKARAELPTDVRVRNDLGYALLLDRQYESARYEFLTVLELDEANDFSISNLVLLLLITDEYPKAQSLAVRKNLSGAAFKELLARAREIKPGTGRTGESRPEAPAETGEIGTTAQPDSLDHSAKSKQSAEPLDLNAQKYLAKTTATDPDQSAANQSSAP
ncbi:MAG: hypothetical protein ACU843_10105 [Gammaproteobacteria bacterium]